MERIHHPLQASPDHVAIDMKSNVIAYGSGSTREFAEHMVRKEIDKMWEGIDARLAAEVELDRIESLWYNSEKGDPHGEETDNGDSL